MDDRAFGVPRSPGWHAAERGHLAKQPKCLVCGREVKLQVHHKYPFHYVVALGRPDLEFDERNLFTLCECASLCHITIGHLGDWELFNPQLEETIALCRGLMLEQIRHLDWYVSVKRQAPKKLGAMTDADKAAMRELLDAKLPRIA